MSTEPAPVRPPPALDIHARWPVHRQLVVDGARIGAAAGVVAGAALAGAWGWLGLVVGTAVGGALSAVAGARRYHLGVDADGVRIGRLLGRTRIPWAEVVAFGCEEGAHGRSGRRLGLAVCRIGEVLPVSVPALTWTASPFRMGGDHPADRLAVHRDAALDPVRDWAAYQRVPVVEEQLDLWWDRHPDAPV